MTNLHKMAVAAAVTVEILMLVGILFGSQRKMTVIGSDRSVREACLALWAVAVPGWFTLESQIFAPLSSDALATAQFVHGQQVGQYIAAFLGLIAATLVGITPPLGPPATKPVAPTQNNPNPPIH